MCFVPSYFPQKIFRTPIFFPKTISHPHILSWTFFRPSYFFVKIFQTPITFTFWFTGYYQILRKKFRIPIFFPEFISEPHNLLQLFFRPPYFLLQNFQAPILFSMHFSDLHIFPENISDPHTCSSDRVPGIKKYQPLTTYHYTYWHQYIFQTWPSAGHQEPAEKLSEISIFPG